jgi:hypothetical protein
MGTGFATLKDAGSRERRARAQPIRCAIVPLRVGENGSIAF